MIPPIRRCESTARVGHDGHPRWDGAQQFAGGLVDQVDFAAIGAQVLELQEVFGMLDSGCEAREGVLAAGGRGDGGGQAVLGCVVDDLADPPDPTRGGLEHGEVGPRPHAGHAPAYFATTASTSSTAGDGHGPFTGSPSRGRARRR
jgi:hypothetical protein